MRSINSMANIKKSKANKSKDKKKNTKKTKVNKPSFDSDVIEKDLCKLLPKEWLESMAKISGLIKRNREIKAFVLFWVLVFSFGAHLKRNLANMKRKYDKESKKDLAYSSWFVRFHPELANFLKLCVTHQYLRKNVKIFLKLEFFVLIGALLPNCSEQFEFL